MAMLPASAQELALISHSQYTDQNTPFRQQTGEKWQPKMTALKSIILCTAIGAVLLVIGGGLYVSVSSIVQTDVQYYESTPVGTAATVTITIDKKMAAPVYVYYRIDNFFQNHRRFVISRDERQLRGLSIANPSTCAPLKSFSDLADHKDHSFTAQPNNTADTSKVLYPCGLAAVTTFSDVLSGCVTRADNSAGGCQSLSWTKTGIDYPSDEKKYVAAYTSDAGFDPTSMTVSSPYVSGAPDGPVGVSGRVLPRLGDEDLTVWMRSASTSNFHKLYRIINDDLNEGDVVTIGSTNTWDVAPFSGKKGVVLSTKHFLGGKSFVLPIVYMIVGAMCVLEAIFVFILTRWCPGYTPEPSK